MFHTTKEGNKILIAQMGNAHLENTIKLLFNRIKLAMAILSEDTKITPESVVFHHKNINKIEQSKVLMELCIDNLPKYIFEATIRWINYTKELQDVLWRSEALKWYQEVNFSLSYNEYGEDDDLYYND